MYGERDRVWVKEPSTSKVYILNYYLVNISYFIENRKKTTTKICCNLKSVKALNPYPEQIACALEGTNDTAT